MTGKVVRDGDRVKEGVTVKVLRHRERVKERATERMTTAAELYHLPLKHINQQTFIEAMLPPGGINWQSLFHFLVKFKAAIFTKEH